MNALFGKLGCRPAYVANPPNRLGQQRALPSGLAIFPQFNGKYGAAISAPTTDNISALGKHEKEMPVQISRAFGFDLKFCT
jgi:hypothetical protein